MYMARLLIVFFLIVAAVLAYQPQTQQRAGETWENIKPVVVTVMDGLYATVRMLIAGDGQNDPVDNAPVAPGGDFDRIVTMNSALPQ